MKKNKLKKIAPIIVGLVVVCALIGLKYTKNRPSNKKDDIFYL